MIRLIKQFYPTLLLLALITYLSLTDARTFADMPTFPHIDKVVHFLMYSAFGFVLLCDFYRNSPLYEIPGRDILIVLGICFTTGIVMEILQAVLTTTRSFELADMVVNLLGTLWGVSLARLFLPYFYKHSRKLRQIKRAL